MPLLASAKRNVGTAMGPVGTSRRNRNHAVRLAVGDRPRRPRLQCRVHLWWADPLAALGIVYIAAREGIAYSRSDQLDDCC
jgi:hypothetical protein